MPRTARIAPGGMVFHVLNRANGRARIFDTPADYDAFAVILGDVQQLAPMRVLGYAVMPNHWHFAVWPGEDGDLGRFMHRLTTTHVRRWHKKRHTEGQGHLYQGTFKSFPVQSDNHLLTVLRYIERNPVRAGLVERAEEWRWTSLWQRANPAAPARPVLTGWPVSRPPDWLARVNQSESEVDLESLRACLARGRPFGQSAWQQATAAALGLQSTLRPRGRPRKEDQ